MIMTMICVLCVYWISACVRVAVHSVCPHIGWQQMIWSAVHIYGETLTLTHTHTVSLSLSLSPSSVIYIYIPYPRVCVLRFTTLYIVSSLIRYSSRTTTMDYYTGNIGTATTISRATLSRPPLEHTHHTRHTCYYTGCDAGHVLYIYIIVVLSIQHIWTIDRS